MSCLSSMDLSSSIYIETGMDRETDRGSGRFSVAIVGEGKFDRARKLRISSARLVFSANYTQRPITHLYSLSLNTVCVLALTSPIN